LKFDERQYVRTGDVGGLFRDIGEDHFEVVGNRKQCVDPGSCGNELQIVLAMSDDAERGVVVGPHDADLQEAGA